MNILGINAYHANASAALVCDGRLVAAVEEERFNRVKYAAGFPVKAIRYCLKAAGITLDRSGSPGHPARPLGPHGNEAVLRPAHAAVRARTPPRLGFLCRHPRRPSRKLSKSIPKRIRARFHRVEHHRAHLASAFFVSPFDRAALLSADGLGDFASTMWAAGEGGRMRIQGAIAFPHSLGMYYTALTQYLGFWKFGDEYKVMGLAAYGQPAYLDEFRRIVVEPWQRVSLGARILHASSPGPAHELARSRTKRRCSAGSFPTISRSASDLRARRKRPWSRGIRISPRASGASGGSPAPTQSQGAVHKQTGQKALCLAGGVAFNCVANAKIFDRVPFERVFVQPAAGDAGLAVGAAFYVWHQILGNPRSFEMSHASWGPEYDAREIRSALEERHLFAGGFGISQLPDEEFVRATARRIAEGDIAGWFSGRAEWGPRALGNRSILADPERRR